MKISQCISCKGRLEKATGIRKQIQYSAYKCNECGEEIMEFRQVKQYLDKASKPERRVI